MPNESPRPSAFQAMLARLRGRADVTPDAEEPTDQLPDGGESAACEPEIPVARPVVPDPEAPAAPAAVPLCPHCQAARQGNQPYCDNCGWIFPKEPAAVVAGDPAAPAARLKDQYELGPVLREAGDVRWFRGWDHGPAGGPVPVVIVREPAPAAAEPVPAAGNAPEDDTDGGEVLPSFEDRAFDTLPTTEILSGQPAWPGIAWDATVLNKARHPSLPAVRDLFTLDRWEYLIVEAPTGQPLWDAWDDPEVSNRQRFSWLKQLAEALHRLHQAGAVLEGFRPDVMVVNAAGQAVITEVIDLLPVPLPAGAPVRATLYTAPELVLGSADADARSDLYTFGAMLYALHVGRELADMDFERPGFPKPFIPRFPDIHPAFGRLVSKTFCREPAGRFPTDEAAREDPTGFAELMRTLDVCGRALDQVRFEVAAWTTTGMVRTGNEDGFALLHAAESRQDDLVESALVLLADGMGGYEAGEVAAALTIQALRCDLIHQAPFAALAGGSAFPSAGEHADLPSPEGVDALKDMVAGALKEANRQVHAAARTGVGRRGMGCTAEVVYARGHDLVVGHVGDSRTYHLHRGRLVQLTRDQTLVNRLVELGTLSPEEAENHPRRSELQQAIGGHSDVDPDVYHATLAPGDWVVVCSDGLSNHVTPAELMHMLQSEATSAETAARRLANFANIKGATDNATVVVLRVT